MGRSPDDSAPESTGPLDRQTLRLFERQLASDPLVAAVQFEPDPYEPRLLRASIDAERYPNSLIAARVDIRWFTTDDFSIHYLENGSNGQWECRWDRHPNTHNTRIHYHEPPTGTSVSDLDLSSMHPLDIYSVVFEAIDRRIESLWSESPHD